MDSRFISLSKLITVRFVKFKMEYSSMIIGMLLCWLYALVLMVFHFNSKATKQKQNVKFRNNAVNSMDAAPARQGSMDADFDDAKAGRSMKSKLSTNARSKTPSLDDVSGDATSSTLEEDKPKPKSRILE
jgi:hypothetical protein